MAPLLLANVAQSGRRGRRMSVTWSTSPGRFCACVEQTGDIGDVGFGRLTGASLTSHAPIHTSLRFTAYQMLTDYLNMAVSVIMSTLTLDQPDTCILSLSQADHHYCIKWLLRPLKIVVGFYLTEATVFWFFKCALVPQMEIFPYTAYHEIDDRAYIISENVERQHDWPIFILSW